MPSWFLSEYRRTNVLINILNTSENWKRNEINTWFSALAIQTQTNYLTFYYVLKLWDNVLFRRFKSLEILMIWLKGKKPPFYCFCVKKKLFSFICSLLVESTWYTFNTYSSFSRNLCQSVLINLRKNEGCMRIIFARCMSLLLWKMWRYNYLKF